MSQLFAANAAPQLLARRDAIRFGIAAILFGIVFVGVTGFAPLEAIHNAAHNTRHAITFPCH